MALVGQIVTVSDVLMDGTVNNYIMGADANVFQTNYNSSGVMTNWSIGNTNGVKIYGTNSATNSLILNVPTYQIQMDDSSMFIGPRTGSNYIYYSGNSRPYFGTCASNYIVGNNDLSYGLEHHNHNDLYNPNYAVYATIGGHAGVDSHQFSVVDKTTGSVGQVTFKSSMQSFGLICGDNQYITSIQGFSTNEGMYLSYSNLGTDRYQTTISIADELTLKANQSQIMIGRGRVSLLANSSLRYGLTIYDNGNNPPSFDFNGLDTVSTGTPALFGGVVSPGEGAYLYAQAGSSRRFKNSISDLIEDSIKADKLYNLPVRQFKYNDNILRKIDCCYNKLIPGFIAEEVNKYYPIATVYNQKENGQLEIENWDVRYIVPPMLKLIQDQHQEIETLKAEIAEIKELLKNK